ncbi:protein crumbs-like isoform X2 [Apostichopus japonicus]|uniref:protein crumbs-like isoform X2 n=1 Tax=Stichopus japonicus TaxID=307972 RepID=UPI003AB65280
MDGSLRFRPIITSSFFFLILLLNLLYISNGQTCNDVPTNTSRAYFDGSASVTVSRTLDLSKTGFSFRTCLGGTILQQNGTNGDFFQLSANESASVITVRWESGDTPGSEDIGANLTLREVSLQFATSNGTLTLTVDGVAELLANGSKNPELLALDLSGSDLVIGEGFTGCVIDNMGTDAGLGLCMAVSHTNVEWDTCLIENSTTCGLGSCNSSPCSNNATCDPFPGGYTCVCPAETFSGICTDEDHCSTGRCMNGVCQNRVNSSFCNCTGSGFTGDSCENDIDDCGSTPCQNGGSCIDRTNGYNCTCAEGYSGSDCSINVNDCESDPCQNGGTCIDGVVQFTCNCTDMWAGDTCSLPTCSANPCKNSAACVSGPDGSFQCQCLDGFGGDVCNVTLTGCVDITCNNGGTCVPQYSDLNDHSYSCLCDDGFRGPSCEMSTVISFRTDHDRFEDQDTYNEDILNYTLTFKTTLPNVVLLFMGVRDEHLNLSLSDGRLKLSEISPQSDVETAVTIGQSLNDGKWHKVVLESLDLLVFNVAVTVGLSNIPSDGSDSCDGSTCQDSLTLTGQLTIFRLGVMEIGGKGDYVGCMRDVQNLDTNKYFDIMELEEQGSEGIEGGCPRENQCNMSTCTEQGTCTDLWWDFSCDCDNGYTGKECSREFTVGTFSFENLNSYASFSTASTVSSANMIRFQFRTRREAGLLFLTYNDASHITIYLTAGQLTADISLGGNQPTGALTTTGPRLNDGEFHLVEFDRQSRDISLSVTDSSGTRRESSNGAIDNTSEPDFDEYWIGGVPDFTSASIPSELDQVGYFKGCILDVKYNEYSLEFFPLPDAAPDTSLPMNTATSKNVLNNSCASDDLCQLSPCSNNGSCQQNGLWNDYYCECTFGYTGKNCENETICGPTRDPCPENSVCIERDESFECVAAGTFQEATILSYTNNINEDEALNNISLRLRTRSDYAVIFRAATTDDSTFINIVIRESFLQITFPLINNGVGTLNTSVMVNDGIWHDVHIQLFHDSVSVEVDSIEVKVDDIDINGLQSMITGPMKTPVQVGGAEFQGSSPFQSAVGFIGCLKDFRIGGHLLPVFPLDEYNPDLPEKFDLAGGEVVIGCIGKDVCGTDDCQNNGSCIDEWEAFSCSCEGTGFEGQKCDVEIDECDSSPCLNGATCLDLLMGYDCLCLAGYEGKNCSVDKDDCAEGNCTNGSTCMDGIDMYTCECPESFIGDFCEFMVMTNCSQDVCENNATCVSKNNPSPGEDGFTCECPTGYTGARCAYLVNYCENVTCQYGGTCSSNVMLQSHECSCVPGFEGEFCETNKDDCGSCQNGATCVDMINDYQCDCVPGFRGKDCDVDIDDCLSEPCLVGNCTDLVNDFTCNCPTGFEGDRCQFKGPCAYLDCENGAECMQTLSQDELSFTGGCECLQGYNGTLCENEIDWCASSPCQNGATCNNTLAGPECTCVPGFGGDFCETPLPNCASDLCQNGANCTDFDFTYECDCPPGFNGTNCEVNIDDCENNNCTNGECVDEITRYYCNCTNTGYNGSFCEMDIDECSSSPCLNGGTCKNLPGDFKCECIEPYTSTFCDKMDVCFDNPCENGGSCSQNGTDMPVCKCSDNFSGTICETFIGPDPNSTNWPLIGGIIAGVVLLVLFIIAVILFINIREQRATAGTYSPSRQEMSGSRVEMDNVLKLPPPERLI